MAVKEEKKYLTKEEENQVLDVTQETITKYNLTLEEQELYLDKVYPMPEEYAHAVASSCEELEEIETDNIEIIKNAYWKIPYEELKKQL